MGVLRQGNSQTRYLFIDGGYLEKVVDDFSQRLGLAHRLPIDFAKVGPSYDRAIYYDAIPVRKKGEPEEDYERRLDEKIRFFDGLRDMPNFHVRDGITRYTRRRGQEQKGVDTLLAIDVLQYAFRGTIDSAEIITGDLDLYPLFEALLQTNTKGTLIYEERSTSKELVRAADLTRRINLSAVLGWCDTEFQRSFAPSKVPTLSERDGIFGTLETEGFGTCVVRTNTDRSVWQATFNDASNVIVVKSEYHLMDAIRQMTQQFDLPDEVPNSRK